MNRGFSLLELLIAITITALLAAVTAAVVPPLHALFEQTPAAIDLQQRGRTAVDTIAQAVRAADQVLLLDADPARSHFRELQTVAPKADGAQGTLARDQSSPGGHLYLYDTGCPAVPDVCGFVRGTVAMIANDSGQFDVFIVGSINVVSGSISPGRSFDRSYAEGAMVVEVDAHTFRLDPQADGSSTLVRQTAAGAIQPIVDRVSELRFERAFGDKGVEVALALQPLRMPAPTSLRRVAVVARNLR